MGLHIAQQLVADGAKQLVLSGRQGVTSTAQEEMLTALAAAGAQVTIVQADVADAAEARQLIDRCRALAPLRGIVHTAGVLDDGVLTAQTPARFAQVMRPKVEGTWQLHTLTAGLALDFFVCFSSVAALVGAPGQSNYAAANAFMDSLMQRRVQQGLPGLSINWGPWAGTVGLRGMAADLQGRMQAQGLTMIAPLQGRLLLGYLLNQSVAQIGVLPLQRQQPVVPPPAAGVDLRQILADLAVSARPARLAAYLRGEIATVLGLRDETPIDPRTRLFDFGLDSLMAVELKNRLEAGLGATLRSTLLFDYPTLEALTAYLLHNVLKLAADDALENSQPSPDDATTASSSAPVELTTVALDELSDEDLIAFITKENQEFS